MEEFVRQGVVVAEHADALESTFASQDLCARAKRLLHVREIDRRPVTDEYQPTSHKFTSGSSICCAADLFDKSLPSRCCTHPAPPLLDQLLAREKVDYPLSVVLETPQIAYMLRTERAAKSRFPEHQIGKLAPHERSKPSNETKFFCDVVLGWSYSHV